VARRTTPAQTAESAYDTNLRAVTQINEATLSFVPKALAMVAVLLLFGPWMLNTLITYTAFIFESMAYATR
jgi:flagellar biosynthesis protein FliQ